MRYRVKSDGGSFLLVIEDGEEVVASLPVPTFVEARRLQRVAVVDGVSALPQPEKPAKKRGK